MDTAPGTVFRKVTETDGILLAIKTDPAVTAGAYFVYSPKNGGGYQDPPADLDQWETAEFTAPPAPPEPEQPEE